MAKNTPSKSKGKLIFILGGTRSGKSIFAERLAKDLNNEVVYIATFPENGDEEMVERIKEHKKMRPKEWKTLEIEKAGDIIQNVGKTKKSVIIIECLTILVSNLLFKSHEKYIIETEESVTNKIDELIASIKNSDNTTIIVSNEVGQGVVPMNKLARKYRDILGKVNQLMAKNADEFYAMFAGIPVEIKRLKF